MADETAHYLEAELTTLVQERSEIFEFLQSGSLDGIWFRDLQNPDNEWISPQLWRLLGYDPADREHLASEWLDMIHPEDRKAAVENVTLHNADSSHPHEQIVRYQHRNGLMIWVRCRGLVIRDSDGNPHRMLNVHNDITRMKQLEQELDRARTELQEFTRATSHDLRAPLRSISGFAQLLERSLGDRLTEKEQHYMMRIDSGVKRMSALVQDLLTYSRLDGEQRRGEVDLNDSLRRIEKALSVLMEETGASIHHDVLPIVNADPIMMRQLLHNLVKNAILYRAPDRTPMIHITSRAEGERWSISVADNGIGIEPRFYARVFELFQKLHSGEGTGVGLALCQKIIILHGGIMSLTSEPGEGTVFTFTLPRA